MRLLILATVLSLLLAPAGSAAPASTSWDPFIPEDGRSTESSLAPAEVNPSVTSAWGELDTEYHGPHSPNPPLGNPLSDPDQVVVPNPVPEPTTLLLLGAGLGLTARRIRRRLK